MKYLVWILEIAITHMDASAGVEKMTWIVDFSNTGLRYFLKKTRLKDDLDPYSSITSTDNHPIVTSKSVSTAFMCYWIIIPRFY